MARRSSSTCRFFCSPFPPDYTGTPSSAGLTSSRRLLGRRCCGQKTQPDQNQNGCDTTSYVEDVSRTRLSTVYGCLDLMTTAVNNRRPTRTEYRLLPKRHGRPVRKNYRKKYHMVVNTRLKNSSIIARIDRSDHWNIISIYARASFRHAFAAGISFRRLVRCIIHVCVVYVLRRTCI